RDRHYSRRRELSLLETDEAEGRPSFRRWMIFSANLPPCVLTARIGHDGIARNVRQDLGELQPVGARQEHSEYFRSADDREWCVARERKGIRSAMRHFRALSVRIAIAR